MNRNLPLISLAVLFGASVTAQSFQDLVDTRNGVHPYASILQFEVGAIGTLADGSGHSAGLEDEISWDSRIYYRDEAFGSRRGTFEAYAGRDGIFAGFTDGSMIGDDTLTRFEFHARPWMFYRDGFYAGDELSQNGLFEGSDYEGYIGFGRPSPDGLYVEFGSYYRTLDFKSSDLTPAAYTLPEDYTAYGTRMYLEHRAVQMDRRRGMPQQGFVMTVIGEREWNDSDGEIGRVVGVRTRLPSAVWRARGRLEWYIPASDATTWEVFVTGGMQDKKDRLQNSEGQRPLGSEWADGSLRMRMHLGESFVVTPFASFQYSKTAVPLGGGSSKDYFFGGGVEAFLHLGQSMSIHGWYSYLDNENRPSISIANDVRGQHMFYLGMVMRFGASRR